jgi:hypothetical protein
LALEKADRAAKRLLHCASIKGKFLLAINNAT